MRNRASSDGVVQHKMPRGLIALGVFWFFGAAMASFAGATLSWPGRALDRIWVLNRTAHKQLATLGKPAGFAFLLLGATLAIAGVGWLKRRVWGWRLAVAVIATQVLGDVVNFSRGDLLRGVVGFSIASGVLFYLLRPTIRDNFNRTVLP